MLKVVTANLNGIRSAAKKGFFEWFAGVGADFLCVQELKVQAPDMAPEFLAPGPYQGYFHYAEKKGYSGAGLYTRHQPDAVRTGFGVPEFDNEGRYVEAYFDKLNLSVISLYAPSGSASPERQASKFRFMEVFLPHMIELRAAGREILLCGDVNIAHQEIDLKNWKSNQKNSGFLPEERVWLTELFGTVGWVDAYRALYPDTTDACYTWWSNRGAAYEKNVG